MKIEARLVEHGPVVECNNQRVLGKPRDAVVGPSGDETAGEQNAEPGMADARQRLGASEAFALEIDLGLVNQPLRSASSISIRGCALRLSRSERPSWSSSLSIGPDQCRGSKRWVSCRLRQSPS